MLKHLNNNPELPNRVVVVGSNSFVAKAVIKKLESNSCPVLPLGRNEVDLLADDAAEKLQGYLEPTDTVLLAAAIAPVKNPDMLKDNLEIARNMHAALKEVGVNHIVNISSDAVYADSEEPLTETSSAEPGSLHGVMHLARELVLQTEIDAPFASVRPTLIYGTDDPHNGYGPNRFRRLAAEGQEIVLFGEGEERRDHVLVDDVAEIIYRVITHKSTGKINIASGNVVSFREAAEMVVSLYENPSEIKGSPRNGPMPHNGYRPFDVSATTAAFPDFSYTQAKEGFAYVHGELSAT